MTATLTIPQAGDRCLSVRNPYAWLIVHGHKKYENRSRPTKFRGRIHIHASLSLAFRDWSEIVGGSPVPLTEGVTLDNGTELPALSEMPCGAILGSVEIFDCKHFSELSKREQADPFAEGPFCYLLRESEVLRRPVAMKGALGIWTFRQ